MSKSFGTKSPVRPHVLSGGGMGKEVSDLRTDINEAFGTLEDLGASGTGPIRVIDYAAPAASDDDYWKGATAAGTGPVVVTTFLAATVAPSRNALLTATVTGTGEGDLLLEGLDPEGNVQTESIAIPAATGPVAGVKPWSKITKMTVPPTTAGMTALSVKLGTGAILGLPSTTKVRNTKLMIIRELVTGVAPATAGTFTSPAAGMVCGTYEPNTAPNATATYVLYTERTVA